MASVTVKSITGAEQGSVELAADVFGVQPNVPLMHQVVTAQLAKRRAGTQSTKTRAEVRGGGRKPYKQKGTGNARQGSIRAPHFSGGGVALGPKPRKFDQKTPKKMIRAALRSALSDRAADGKIVVVDDWGITEPKTRDAVNALAALGLEGKLLVVLKRDEVAAIKSFRNLPGVQLIEIGELNAYDVLCNDWIVFTKNTLPVANTPAKGRAVEEPAAVQEEPAVEDEPAIAQDEPAVEDEPATEKDES
jgi:large subunit ribosomal protein L4